MNCKCLFSVVAGALLFGCATVRGPVPEKLIAHRGESFDAPENTLPAYKTAVERGFGFECDIYLSKDRRLFTFHDHDLKRTTGGIHSESCTKASWEETVSKVNVGGWGKWKGSRFDPTHPALFSEAGSTGLRARRGHADDKLRKGDLRGVSDILTHLTHRPLIVVDRSFWYDTCNASASPYHGSC